mgnify:FL=1
MANKIENKEQLQAALIPSFWLTQLILLIPAGILLWFFYLRNDYSLQFFFSGDNLLEIGLYGTVVALIGMGAQFLAWRLFPKEAFDDGGVNRLLLEQPARVLFFMFLIGAFSE